MEIKTIVVNEKDLCEAIEQKLGRKITTSQDFAWLEDQVWEHTHQVVSLNTLKRLWGYLTEERQVRPSRRTLDVLSQLAGYRDYATFSCAIEANRKGGKSSNRVLARHMETKVFDVGIMVEVRWKPDRRIVMKKTGQPHSFIITEAEKTKLSVGDRCDCPIIIENEPLYLDNLQHNDSKPLPYVAGRLGGVHFEVIEE